MNTISVGIIAHDEEINAHREASQQLCWHKWYSIL